MEKVNTVPSQEVGKENFNLIVEWSGMRASENKTTYQISKNRGMAPKAVHSCPFCSVLKNSKNEYWIKDLNFGSLFLNYNQSYRGRCIYMLNEHFDSLQDLDGEQFATFNKEVLYLSHILKAAFSAELINIAILGNAVRHVHWHLIPRYATDENRGKAPWPQKDVKLDSTALKKIKEQIIKQLILQ